MRAAFPDPAVVNDVLLPVQAGLAVNLLEFVVGAEGAIIIGCLAPRHVDRGRNVSATLCLLLRQVGWGKESPRVFIRTANIDQALSADRVDNLITEGSDVEVGLGGRVASSGSGDRYSTQVSCI